jgi:hypothetical protein
MLSWGAVAAEIVAVGGAGAALGARAQAVEVVVTTLKFRMPRVGAD